MISDEKMYELSSFLNFSPHEAIELLEKKPVEAVAILKERNLDFTQDELKSFGKKLRKTLDKYHCDGVLERVQGGASEKDLTASPLLVLTRGLIEQLKTRNINWLI